MANRCAIQTDTLAMAKASVDILVTIQTPMRGYDVYVDGTMIGARMGAMVIS